jgi:flagellar assembly factor FliW
VSAATGTELTVAAPLPGMESLTTFSLVPVEHAVGLFSLESTEDEEVRLYLLDSATHLPDYRPRFSDEQLGRIGTPAAGGLSILTIVNTSGGRPTVNLLAPLLVNDATGACAQVILDGQDWPLRAPLLAPA